jgi:hypothetical protein
MEPVTIFVLASAAAAAIRKLASGSGKSDANYSYDANQYYHTCAKCGKPDAPYRGGDGRYYHYSCVPD